MATCGWSSGNPERRSRRGALEVLDADAVLRADPGAAAGSREIRGTRAVAEQALALSRAARFSRPALVNGAAGLVTAPGGEPFAVMGFTIRHGRIAEMDILADPERLGRLELVVLDDRATSQSNQSNKEHAMRVQGHLLLTPR